MLEKRGTKHRHAPPLAYRTSIQLKMFSNIDLGHLRKRPGTKARHMPKQVCVLIAVGMPFPSSKVNPRPLKKNICLSARQRRVLYATMI